MSDANTGQTVECPICETSFDPTVAGGWCTNTDCGEWQYTGDGDGESAGESTTDSDQTDDTVSVPGTADDGDEPAESDDAEPADTSAEDVESDDESVADPEAEADTSEPEAVPEAETGAAESETEVDATETAPESESEPAADIPEDETETEDTAAVSQSADETAEPEPADTDAEPAAEEPSTIDCPGCGATLDAEVNFCPDCGTDVQDLEPGGPLTECPNCDSNVEPDDNFCVNCGEDLTAHRDGSAAESPDTDSRDDAAAEATGSSTDTGADETENAIDALESADETPVPDSLVLDVVGREIAVDDGDKVGREIRAALTDAGRPEDEAVRIHREHVRFVREDDSFYLLDLGDNPTELNGQTLQKGDREPVEPGDEIELSGVATVTVRAP